MKKKEKSISISGSNSNSSQSSICCVGLCRVTEEPSAHLVPGAQRYYSSTYFLSPWSSLKSWELIAFQYFFPLFEHRKERKRFCFEVCRVVHFRSFKAGIRSGHEERKGHGFSPLFMAFSPLVRWMDQMIKESLRASKLCSSFVLPKPSMCHRFFHFYYEHHAPLQMYKR